MTEFGKTYGNALFLLAQEEKLEEKLCDELTSVCEVIKENPEYMRLISSRNIPLAERLSLLEEAFAGKVHEYILSFIKILCERGAFDSVHDCLAAYKNAFNEAHGIIKATAISAVAMTATQREELIAVLERKTGKKIELTEKTDASLRGGMCVEMNGIRYDNTIANRFNSLRRALTAKS